MSKYNQSISIGESEHSYISSGDMKITITNDRQKKLEPVETERAKKSKKKILFLAANPKATQRLRLEEEAREIEEGLRRAKQRNLYKFNSRWAVRLRDLRRALLAVEPQVVHFTGHGKDDGLLVEDELGMAISISPKALAGLFALCTDQVECVILSACYSALQATAINKHINYVIGMRRQIKDKAAIEFAVGFYDALAAGKSLEEAFEFGRNAILQEFPDQTEHLIPVLKKKKR
jgi:CHAT domain-containing protein